MERRTREQSRPIVDVAAPHPRNPCPACDGRALVVTTPPKGGNRYKLAANRARRANGAKHRVRAGAFRQSRCVRAGAGEVQFSLRHRETSQSFERDGAWDEATEAAAPHDIGQSTLPAGGL